MIKAACKLLQHLIEHVSGGDGRLLTAGSALLDPTHDDDRICDCWLAEVWSAAECLQSQSSPFSVEAANGSSGLTWREAWRCCSFFSRTSTTST
jgi:hypothetical protein